MTPDFGRKILVLVPHPDDEVVGCCAAIGRARAAGAQVFALYLTTGIPEQQVLWPWHRAAHGDRVETRRDEAKRVGNLIGLTPVGFSDNPSRQLRHHMAETKVRIENAITEHAIDTLWTPAYEGGHQDHDTANALSSRFSEKIRVLEFAEYNFLGGRVNSQSFTEENGSEIVLDLSQEEIDRKNACLAIYRSEKANLSYVESRRECLRPLSNYAYDKPIHSGRLFYERFHWVPFRHPRVDFTPSKDVRETLATFLESEK
jgi:N-acetylglucosamine malate deacetylase 1